MHLDDTENKSILRTEGAFRLGMRLMFDQISQRSQIKDQEATVETRGEQ